MLINITESFLDGLDSVSDQFIYDFEDLISQHIKQNHYLSATRKVASRIATILENRLSVKSKKILNLISNQSNDSIRLVQNIKFHIEIRTASTDGMFIDKKGEKTIWVCNVHYVCQWCSHPLKIIGEHVTDGNACKEAGRHFSIINSYIPKMQKSTIEMSGGCGNADTVLNERLTDAIAPIFCFVDSDKISPNHLGSSAIKKCTALIKEKTGIATFYATSTRELENTLPFKFIESTVNDFSVSSDRDNILTNLNLLDKIKQTTPQIYQFADLKEGTCQTWVKLQTPDVIEHYRSVKIVAPCTCSPKCDGVVSPPVIKNLLEKVINKMNLCSPKEVKTLIQNDNDSDWLNFGEIVFSMALANHVRLT